MKLLKAIEVGYFRSIYKQSLDKLTDMTVIFGRNDSGKSNYLRALNLFFNDFTNPNQSFDFSRDFNHGRLDECSSRVDTRKFTYVKLTFSTPKNWRNSLGEEFWVKKTWSVSRGDEYILETSVDSSKQQFLTRFLNKVKFHYVPAIKDRRIFENLLGQVYEVISSHEGFAESLKDFTEELQVKTSDISSGLLAAIGVNSAIAPPEDLTDLFRSLDFETKNESGDAYSLTLQKGDGVQVRHIPAILGFLSDKGREDFHIWGFEEPENSLELANAVSEAKTFLEFSKDKNKQIFITSHSPAFFSLTDDVVKRFFVSQIPREGLNKKVSRAELVKPGDVTGELMEETPLLPVISNYLQEAHVKIEELKESARELSETINKYECPFLFVEGESDLIILKEAWNIFGDANKGLKIESCSGTTKMEGLAKDGRILEKINPNAKVFVLIDNDKEGRELSSFENRRLGDGGVWVRHKSNGSYWCRLEFSDEFATKMTSWKIPNHSWPYTIENCFPLCIHRMAQEEGAIVFNNMPHDELLNCDKSKVFAVDKAKDENYTYLRAPNPDYKIKFAEWVVEKAQQDPKIIEPFRSILEELDSIISGDD